MRTNIKPKAEPVFTYEGAKAVRVSPLQTLRRLSLAALLFEDQHYQSGGDHAREVWQLVAALVLDGKAPEVAALAVECRTRMYLRHMPLFLLAALTQHKGCGPLVAAALPQVIQRADELAEFVALYAKQYPAALRAKTDYRTGAATGARAGLKLSAGAKRGLAAAFARFSEYDLAKYDRAGAVRLRDVLRLVHPVPTGPDQAALWKRLATDQLATPDTWEVALSAGGDKKDVFERLLRERKLGGLAFLRNLRNMLDAHVDVALIRERFNGPFEKVLPFRFLAAAKHAPKLEAEIDAAMLRAAGTLPKLPGHTVLVVDCSGSMNAPLSGKSELSRLDAAAALAVLAREQCEAATIVATAGNDASQKHASMLVPARRGMALRDVILGSRDRIGGGGIFLVQVMEWVHGQITDPVDRVVVFTDEQDCDHKQSPDTARRMGASYLVNVGAYTHGIAYKPWVHVDGFSERVLDFVREDSAQQ